MAATVSSSDSSVSRVAVVVGVEIGVEIGVVVGLGGGRLGVGGLVLVLGGDLIGLADLDDLTVGQPGAVVLGAHLASRFLVSMGCAVTRRTGR
jgi:hypothetical protein